VAGNLSYDVFVNDPPPQAGFLPNGEPKRFSPMASTLIYGDIVAGHQNSNLDDDAGRTIAQTRQYLDDADELLRTENSAVGFFNAKIHRYPGHLGRMILWVSASAIYGVREHPGEDARQIIVASWL
jgi:hypothetical protein